MEEKKSMSKAVKIGIAVVAVLVVAQYVWILESRIGKLQASQPIDATQSIVNTNARIDSLLTLTQANTQDILSLACVLRPDFSPICQQLITPGVGGEVPQDAPISVGGEVPLN